MPLDKKYQGFQAAAGSKPASASHDLISKRAQLELAASLSASPTSPSECHLIRKPPRDSSCGTNTCHVTKRSIDCRREEVSTQKVESGHLVWQIKKVYSLTFLTYFEKEGCHGIREIKQEIWFNLSLTVKEIHLEMFQNGWSLSWGLRWTFSWSLFFYNRKIA